MIDAQIERLKQVKSIEEEMLNKQVQLSKFDYKLTYIINKKIKEVEIKAEETEKIKRQKIDQLKVLINI